MDPVIEQIIDNWFREEAEALAQENQKLTCQLDIMRERVRLAEAQFRAAEQRNLDFDRVRDIQDVFMVQAFEANPVLWQEYITYYEQERRVFVGEEVEVIDLVSDSESDSNMSFDPEEEEETPFDAMFM